MSELKKKMKAFEALLDAELASLQTHRYGADESLGLACNFFEAASVGKSGSGVSGMLGRGITMLAYICRKPATHTSISWNV